MRSFIDGKRRFIDLIQLKAAIDPFERKAAPA
jgi:hypothetical protein